MIYESCKLFVFDVDLILQIFQHPAEFHFTLLNEKVMQKHIETAG